jgi:hypothetical protein
LKQLTDSTLIVRTQDNDWGVRSKGLSDSKFPDSDGLVVGAGDEERLRRVEGANPIVMGLNGLETFLRLRVPHADRLVRRSCTSQNNFNSTADHQLRRHGKGDDGLRVPAKNARPLLRRLRREDELEALKPLDASGSIAMQWKRLTVELRVLWRWESIATYSPIRITKM